LKIKNWNRPEGAPSENQGEGMKKAFVAAVALSVFSFGCAMTPKHGNRGPASIGKAKPANPTCEDNVSNKCDPNNPNCTKSK
jgi:hypothetical protein